MIRVVIVAAYASMRAGLHALLSDLPDIEVVGRAASAADLDDLLPDARPDVILVDADRIPAAAIDITGSAGAALVALLDGDVDVAPLAKSPLPGAAFLNRDAEGARIAAAIRAAAAGLLAFDFSVVASLAPPREAPVPDAAGDLLTPREHEVLQQMARGLPNKAIAAHLGISLHTAKFHVASLLAKLGAESRTEAVTLGARQGLVTL